MANESACVFHLKSASKNNVMSDLKSVTSKNNEIIEQYRLIFEQLWLFGMYATKKIQRLETEFDVASVIHEVDKKGIKQFVEKLISTSNMKSCSMLLPYGGSIILYQKIFLGS